VKITFECNAITELSEAAEILVNYFSTQRHFAFYGEMGSGKTTLIKAICAELGVKDVVNSPTYGLVNEYKTGNGSKIYHFDFYRLNSIEEALDIGVEEYLNAGSYCLMEWPEKIAALLPETIVNVNIAVKGEVRVIGMELVKN
jgi:tRNA threonylcarbamoyladenosine biosynthesis protein TsaE